MEEKTPVKEFKIKKGNLSLPSTSNVELKNLNIPTLPKWMKKVDKKW
jgi:pectate lyase